MLQQANHTEAFQLESRCNTPSMMSQTVESGVKQQQKGVKQIKITKDSYWGWKEQQTYLYFLKEHMPMITSSQYRRKNRIFKKISGLLGTRTAVQVKSHHQKLEEKYKTIPRIIQYLQKWLEDTQSHFLCEDEEVSGGYKRKEELVKVDVSIQTDPPYANEAFFEPEYLENYIYSLISFEKDYLFLQ